MVTYNKAGNAMQNKARESHLNQCGDIIAMNDVMKKRARD